MNGSRAIDKAQSYDSGVRGMYGDTSFAEPGGRVGFMAHLHLVEPLVIHAS